MIRCPYCGGKYKLTLAEHLRMSSDCRHENTLEKAAEKQKKISQLTRRGSVLYDVRCDERQFEPSPHREILALLRPSFIATGGGVCARRYLWRWK